MHVFVDEVGDWGYKFHKRSTKHFLIGFAYFSTTAYKDCVDLIKKKIETKSGKVPKELKFRSTSEQFRYDLLKELIQTGGTFGYIYVDKERVYPHLRDHPNINYVHNQMMCYLIENLVRMTPVHDDIIVYVDRRSSNKEIKKDLDKYLPRKITPLIIPHKLKVVEERSHNSRGVQCADFICGSAFKRIEKGDPRYYNVIKNSIIIEKELFRFNKSIK